MGLHPRLDALKSTWESGSHIKAAPHTKFRGDALPLLPELVDDDSSDEAETNSNTDFFATDYEPQQ